jgi:23S rRNA (guanine2445-N2)-methyltransferase / 23S rRNA (guanine2069-N7)-methyltransferase
LKAKRTHNLFNGPIECRLLRFDVEPKHFERKHTPGALPTFDTDAARARPGAEMFANRLRKNVAALGSWARTEGVACYRVYDADMPEYAFSIDLYQTAVEPGGERWVYVQEYAPPATVDAAKARTRREEAFAVIPEVIGVAHERVHLRTRRRQKGGAQYTKLAARGEFQTVLEGGLNLLVNFTDYLDTGLFLDHRPMRARIRELAAGKAFCRREVVIAVAVDVMGGGISAGHEGCAAGRADRGLAIGPHEGHALSCQTVQVGRVDRAVAVRADRVVALLIGGYPEDVRFLDHLPSLKRSWA